MSGHGQPGGHGNGAGLAVGGLASVALIAAGGTYVPVAFTKPPGYTGQGLFDVMFGLIGGQITWTTGCTVAAVAEGAVAALLATGGAWAWNRAKRRRNRVDRQARHMARAHELHHLSPEGVEESARRLRPSLADVKELHADETGVLICHLLNGLPLRQSWEDMAVDIWGPRTGKTTSRAIPAIVASPGPVLVTSVKGDIVDATRGPREARGRIWTFDLQAIWGALPQQMWWNPLRPIKTVTDARRLAEHFNAAERPPGTVPDPFFGPEGEELTANLILAAAVDGRTLIDAYRWANSQRDDTPARILREHGFDDPAFSVEGHLNLPPETRGGVFGGAAAALRCLTEPSVAAWVTPPKAGSTLQEFDPAAFVASTDTLYLLSQGGPGSPAPLVAALTDATLRAGEDRARTSRGRRLDPPLLSVLDEAANICRMRQLPALYSFFGSLGMPIITILQSYAQGVDVWGREGMRKLWSAANVRTYGGGVADPDFLKELSDLIGTYEMATRSTTSQGTGWGDHSVTSSTRKESILDVAALHAMPRGRMVVSSSGAAPALARTAPWQKGPYADAIRASIARWDPDNKVNWTLDPEPTGDGTEPVIDGAAR